MFGTSRGREGQQTGIVDVWEEPSAALRGEETNGSRASECRLSTSRGVALRGDGRVRKESAKE